MGAGWVLVFATSVCRGGRCPFVVWSPGRPSTRVVPGGFARNDAPTGHEESPPLGCGRAWKTVRQISLSVAFTISHGCNFHFRAGPGVVEIVDGLGVEVPEPVDRGLGISVSTFG